MPILSFLGDITFLLVQRFGELIRKLWNPRHFKAHVSPHEMLQAVVLCSKKQFQITEQGDSVAFLSWLLNALHLALGGTKKRNSSIIYKTFQGCMRIYTKKILPTDVSEERKKEMLSSGKPKAFSFCYGGPFNFYSRRNCTLTSSMMILLQRSTTGR